MMAYLWESGQAPEFSTIYGHMCLLYVKQCLIWGVWRGLSLSLLVLMSAWYGLVIDDLVDTKNELLWHEI